MEIKLKEGTGCYILKVFCNDEYFSDCEYAYVELTTETKQAASDGYDFYRTGQNKLGDYNLGTIKLRLGFNVTWLPTSATSNDDESLDFDCILNSDSGNCIWEVEPISKEIISDNEDSDELRVETEYMGIDQYGVMFDCYVKHTDIKLYTESIDINNFNVGYSKSNKEEVTA